MQLRAYSTGVAITNPLVLYRALIATKRIVPDPAQHRLALHLQKLYEELIDYEPIVQYKQRLDRISKTLSSNPAAHLPAAEGHSPGPSEADGAASHGPRRGLFQSLLDRRKVDKEKLALTRVLTDHEQVLQLDSPRGLMLHGEVGTGKSMLIDLFADCLPNRKKRRWHFTTFMLETFSKLEQLRRSRQMVIPSSLGQQDDYSLLWLAREMISTSPILFLDEFQLPDRAASKIMTNLMTSFFHMGGVLIATSNRMPEELSKAAGIEFTPPPSNMGSLGWRFGFGGARGGQRSSSTLSSGGGDFAAFLEVLKARCEVWEMENGRDYRRREAEMTVKDAVGEEATHNLSTQGFDGLEEMAAGNIGLGYEQSTATKDAGEDQKASASSTALPKHYFVRPSVSNEGLTDDSFLQSFSSAENEAVGETSISGHQDIPWKSGTVRVYGRNIPIPRHYNGATSWTFEELCESTFGPADYITIASTYHTLILTKVPVLTVLQKNEARRFINLLDALYEARCKLLITADAGPDEIFFPESKNPKANSDEETISQDEILPETLSEIYQDATAPFRPNISSYEASSSEAPLEPDYTHSRLAGIFSEDQLEDGPPNRVRSRHRPDSSEGMGRGDSIHGLDPSIEEVRDRIAAQQRVGPNFSQAGIFTGEDEKFAYKRARSRLWEMCGARWWARSGEGWWKPLDSSVRTWERPVSASAAPLSNSSALGDVVSDPAVVAAAKAAGGFEAGEAAAEEAQKERMGASREIDEDSDSVLFRHGGSPFRTASKPPPKFQWTHFWGMMKWGKKAGAWGQGVDALEEGMKERKRRKESDGKGDGN